MCYSRVSPGLAHSDMTNGMEQNEMSDPMMDKETVGVLLAGVSALVAFGYKALRILKSDKTSDAIDSDEQQFRRSLREEAKQLRDRNILLMDEKIELITQLAKAEARIDFLEKKCEICAHKLGEANDQT